MAPLGRGSEITDDGGKIITNNGGTEITDNGRNRCELKRGGVYKSPNEEGFKTDDIARKLLEWTREQKY